MPPRLNLGKHQDIAKEWLQAGDVIHEWIMPYTLVVRLGNMVRGLAEIDRTKYVMAVAGPDEFFPPVDILYDDGDVLVYQMPFYTVLENLNSDQAAMFALLRRVAATHNLSQTLPDDLPPNLHRSLTRQLETADNLGLGVMFDIRLENIGWEGNKPILFDGLYYATYLLEP